MLGFDPSMDQALEHMRATGWRNEGTAGGVSCSSGFTLFRAVEDISGPHTLQGSGNHPNAHQ